MLTTAVTVATVILVSDKPALWARWAKNRINRIFQFVVRQYRFCQTVWLIWISKTEFRCSVDFFNRSHSPSTTSGEATAAMELTHIHWMGDYYIVRAYGFLVKLGRCVRSEIWNNNSWPSNVVAYRYTWLQKGESRKTTAARLSRDSRCQNFQSFFREQCPSARFEHEQYRRTLAYNRTGAGTQANLIEGVPECSSCWQIEPIRNMVRLWTRNLLEGELAHNPAILAAGDRENFSELVGRAVSEVRATPKDTSSADKGKMLSLLESALDYRLKQLQSISGTEGVPSQWSEADEKNFVRFVSSESRLLFPTLET